MIGEESDEMQALADRLEEFRRKWASLMEWLSQARGRDYVTRTPAVVLQKMRDLMGETE